MNVRYGRNGGLLLTWDILRNTEGVAIENFHEESSFRLWRIKMYVIKKMEDADLPGRTSRVRGGRMPG